jgi:hypothetical protein
VRGMAEDLEEANALDKTFEIASRSDGVVILTYSLSYSPIHGILSKLKPPKKIRIMYSAKTDAQRTLLQLNRMEKNFKALEIFGSMDHFETSHAKVYVFCKTSTEYIDLTVILGSFNLTLQTLMGIEIYGVYKFQINRDFFEENGIKHFVEIFDLEGQFNLDLESLKKNILGEDRKIGYQVLLLLLQLWFKDIPIVTSNSTFENVNFFGEENRRMLVSTFGKNTHLLRLSDLLRSAFIYADEVGEEVELIAVTPFHTEEAIERLFLLRDQVARNTGLEGKVKFSLKLLTNNFNVSGEIDKSSFSDPMFLRRMMFESKRSLEFKVKFWGYTPGNEDFIHAKMYAIKVGKKRAFLLTSANLTMAGFGFELRKNLEVGVIENQPEYTQKLSSLIDSFWNSENAIESKDDKIWSELQNWYDRLEEGEEGVEADFEVEGLKNLFIYEKNVLRVRDKRSREIEFMKLTLGFPKKEKPVKNLEEAFEKRGDWFWIQFRLKEDHLGPVFCDITARLKDGSYVFVAQQKINVLQKFPIMNIELSPGIDVSRNFLSGTIPVKVEIETGKGISIIDLAKISFELETGEQRFRPEILLIKDQSNISRTLQILLFTEPIEAVDDLHLGLFYENEKIKTCRIPGILLKEIFKKVVDENILSFLKEKSVRLVTDERTLCPKIESELELNFDLNVPKSLKVDRIKVVRNFSYSELVGMKRVSRQVVDEVQFGERIKLDNSLPSCPPTDIETWVYGVRKDEWTWWVPFGKLNYQLLKNPPELEFEDYTPIKTNVTPIEMQFNLKGTETFRDRMVLDYEICALKNSFSARDRSFVCRLPENLDLEKLEKGADLRYRFIFKYNAADIAGKIHINYDFFISSPHPNDCTKRRMLICDLKEPQELLKNVNKEIRENERPFLTVIPTNTTSSKEFRIQLNDKNFEESRSYLVLVKNGTFALKRLDQETLDQFRSGRNIANFRINIVPKGVKNWVTIPFDILYLEGIETDCVAMRRGGYGKAITIYHPDEYADDFKEDIIKIVCVTYSNHLVDCHIASIAQGGFSWVIPKRNEEEVIAEIRNFIEEVKSEKFEPHFQLRKPLPQSDETTMSGRRVIDFILFIRRKKHELRIEVNEPSTGEQVDEFS